MFGSIAIAAADPSSAHRCASASITWQLLIELFANVGKSEGAKRRNSGAGRPGRVTGGLNEGLGRHRTPECAASAARLFGSIVVAAAGPSSVHICASASITWQLLIELFAYVGKSGGAKRRNSILFSAFFNFSRFFCLREANFQVL